MSLNQVKPASRIHSGFYRMRQESSSLNSVEI